MPELPEVETTRRGIEPHVLGRRVTGIVVRNRSLRWPVPRRLDREMVGEVVRRVERRAKYLLLGTDGGTAILHLGMSGSLRVVPHDTPPEKHDHIDLVLETGLCLRLRDPRRFGAVLWTRADPGRHVLLSNLGPEPMDDALDGAYLYAQARGRRAPLRNFLLDSRIVAGVGNIYANEAAFLAGIRPQRAAGQISRRRYDVLAGTVRSVIEAAIESGGTTLKDFVRSDGRPGFFRQHLHVYGREGEPCHECDAPILRKVIGARSAFYCSQCQR